MTQVNKEYAVDHEYAVSSRGDYPCCHAGDYTHRTQQPQPLCMMSAGAIVLVLAGVISRKPSVAQAHLSVQDERLGDISR